MNRRSGPVRLLWCEEECDASAEAALVDLQHAIADRLGGTPSPLPPELQFIELRGRIRLGPQPKVG